MAVEKRRSAEGAQHPVLSAVSTLSDDGSRILGDAGPSDDGTRSKISLAAVHHGAKAGAANAR